LIVLEASFDHRVVNIMVAYVFSFQSPFRPFTSHLSFILHY